MKRISSGLITAIFALTAWQTTSATPSPGQLADRIEAQHEEQLSRIERVTIVGNFISGFPGDLPTSATYVKTEENGRTILKPLNEEVDAMNMAGMHDGTTPDMVRAASSVESDTLNGKSVYVVLIDDIDFLRNMSDMNWDEEIPEEYNPKQLTVWLDSSDYSIHQAELIQAGPQGGDTTITIQMLDYRTMRGLPIAYRTTIKIEGIEQLISPDELATARQQMQELQTQLADMPEAQRAMIEAYLTPQIEQLENMMREGSTTLEMQVTDVHFE
jgi:hypothetical protein